MKSPSALFGGAPGPRRPPDRQSRSSCTESAPGDIFSSSMNGARPTVKPRHPRPPRFEPQGERSRTPSRWGRKEQRWEHPARPPRAWPRNRWIRSKAQRRRINIMSLSDVWPTKLCAGDVSVFKTSSAARASARVPSTTTGRPSAKRSAAAAKRSRRPLFRRMKGPRGQWPQTGGPRRAWVPNVFPAARTGVRPLRGNSFGITIAWTEFPDSASVSRVPVHNTSSERRGETRFVQTNRRRSAARLS
jgi:hypothetical protein